MSKVSEGVIKKAAAGDTEAFELIYREYGGFVYNVALRMVHQAQDAQEVTQEVFILIYRKLKNFRFQSALKTWIYRITINTAVNMSKKWSKERGRMVEYNDQLETSAVFDDPRVEMDQGHNEKLVSALLKRLNADQRACVILRNIEGLSYEEISRVLNVNINTVRSRLKRAREALLRLGKEVTNEM